MASFKDQCFVLISDLLYMDTLVPCIPISVTAGWTAATTHTHHTSGSGYKNTKWVMSFCFMADRVNNHHNLLSWSSTFVLSHILGSSKCLSTLRTIKTPEHSHTLPTACRDLTLLQPLSCDLLKLHWHLSQWSLISDAYRWAPITCSVDCCQQTDRQTDRQKTHIHTQNKKLCVHKLRLMQQISLE